jgi:hypothetical protein
MARRSSGGRLYIVRLHPAVDPVNAEYVLTFGSPAATEIALNLGSVRGLDGLTDVLRAGRVPVNEIEKAWRVLAVEMTHQIPNFRLTPAVIRLLNL